MAEPVQLAPVIAEVIEEIRDRKRMTEGIQACKTRLRDFTSELEMTLTGIAMIPEARQLMTDRLTEYWRDRSFSQDTDYSKREIIIGAGFTAATYCANRVRAGFPKPVVLEQGYAYQVGGAFAVSLNPVFLLNSRNRPGRGGLPDQDMALNYLPGGLLQPDMLTSAEYSSNADMAWLIRLALAQYADVYPGVTVIQVTGGSSSSYTARVTLAGSSSVLAGRVLDARGTGPAKGAKLANGTTVLTFQQLMARMGGLFPLRGVRQVAIIGGGNSGLCAAESLLGIAPGHMSVAGLDFAERADLYAVTIDGQACDSFRAAQRGRYIRLAQYLTGNVSNPSTRLRVTGERGYAVALPGGVLVNDRTYDMAVLCTGSELPNLGGSLSYFPVVRGDNGTITERALGTIGKTTLATQAIPYQAFRIGPAAGIAFSQGEISAGISEVPASKIAMFRLGPRTAALAATLPGLG